MPSDHGWTASPICSGLICGRHRTDPEIAKAFARVTFKSDNRADLPKVSVPTLILQCKEDIIASMQVGEFLHRQIPGSEMVVLDATGHCPKSERAEGSRVCDADVRLT